MSWNISRRDFTRICSGFLASSLMLKNKTQAAEKPLGVLNPRRMKASDFRLFMRIGLDHIYNGAIDRRHNCMPFVRFNLTEPPTWAKHIDWGCPHMVGRFLDALAVCSTVIDFEPDEEADSAFKKYTHDSLDNEYMMPFHITINPSHDGKRSGWIHNSREILLALTGLQKWKGDQQSGDLAKKFVRTIDAVTGETGRFPSGSIGSDGWGSYSPEQLNMCSGRLIRALLQYYRETNDELGVVLAKRFADINIKETFTPEGELQEASGNHLHSTQGTMTGILDLGFLTSEKRYSDIGRKLYDVGLRPWKTSYGWAKEYKTYADKNHWHYLSGEANNTGDYIESALLLGLNGAPEYFRDAECFIRNGLLAAQVINTDWIEQSDEKDTMETVYSNIRRRARGAFVFTTPNGYQHYHTDLMGGALQSLCEAYHAVVSQDSAGCNVNMLFTAESEWLNVHSGLPETGQVMVQVKKPCNLILHIPGWVNKRTVRLTVNNSTRNPDWKREVLIVGDVAPETRVEITFDQPKHHTTEAAPGYDYPFEIDWIGDTITDMKPGMPGRISLY